MSITKDYEEAAQQENELLRKLFPLEVRGRAKQRIEVAILDPEGPSAVATHRIDAFTARCLKSRLLKEASKLSEILEILDRENGLVS